MSAHFMLRTRVTLEDAENRDEILAYLHDTVAAMSAAAEPFVEIDFVLIEEDVGQRPPFTFAGRTYPGSTLYATRDLFVPASGEWRSQHAPEPVPA